MSTQRTRVNGRFTRQSGARTGYRRWRQMTRRRWDRAFGMLAEVADGDYRAVWGAILQAIERGGQ